MPQFSVGEVILNGKYRIEKLLGEGAFGEVYLATHLNLKALRALKVLRKEGERGVGSTVYGHARRRFLLESALGEKLGSHPRIIQVMDFDEAEDLMVLALEYAPGGSLQKRLESLREEGELLPIADILRIAVETAEGLSALHGLDVVHRDLKPGNILFDKEGHAKVADFGLAQVPHSDSRRSVLSMPEPHPGTPGYMSPEQTRPPYDVLTPASDIYALGAMIFEMLTGRTQYTQRPGTRPSDLRAGVPAALDDLVLRMLSKDPQERPWDGAEAARLLGAIEQDLAGKRSREADRVGSRKSIPIWGWLLGVPVLLVMLFFAVRGIVKPPSPTLEPTQAPVIVPTTAPTAAPTAVPAVVPTTMPTATPTSTAAPTAVPTMATTADPSVPPACIETGQEWVSPVDGMTLVCVPAGQFSMGINDGNDDEKPMHDVYLDAYWIDHIEVTNGHYANCVASGACTLPVYYTSYTRADYYDNMQYANYPVIYVSRNQAAAYCAWAGRSLPTEAQWEKAARGTDGRMYPWGNKKPTCTLANFAGCVGDTAAVGSYAGGASPYGALDMAGNVWEWTTDWYGPYSSAAQSNPTGPVWGDVWVQRGASWADGTWFVRSTFRRRLDPDYRPHAQGFRCALSHP